METAPAIEDIYFMAYHMYKSGRYLDAENFFRLLTTLDTRNQHHWMGLGASLQQQKKFAEAVDAYGAAAVFDEAETNPYPHMHAAECLFSLNDLERARKALESALALAKKDASHALLLNQLRIIKKSWKTL